MKMFKNYTTDPLFFQCEKFCALLIIIISKITLPPWISLPFMGRDQGRGKMLDKKVPDSSHQKHYSDLPPTPWLSLPFMGRDQGRGNKKGKWSLLGDCPPSLVIH
jgi:hypothetical protein